MATKKTARPAAKPAKPKTKKAASSKISSKAGSKSCAKTAAATVSFKPSDRIQRQKNVAWRLIDGEAVIITPSDSTMHSLNETGTRIWELLGQNQTVAQVAERIREEFDVTPEVAQKDTLWFIQCLSKKGLVSKG